MKRKKQYDYSRAAHTACYYENSGSEISPLKRVLRKLVRAAVDASREVDFECAPSNVADRIARELVP